MTVEEYRQAVRDLAREATMPRDVAARMEQTLDRALRSAAPPARSQEPARRRRDSVLAAVAALVLIVGAGAWYTLQHITVNNVTETAPEAGVNEKDVQLKVNAAQPDAPRSRSVRLPPSPRLRRTAVASAEAGQADRKQARRMPPVIRLAGFVSVPTAAELPRFESGVIVRMSLPVTALPSFGVDISAASGDQPVEADVLVGQDGLARAIRLVNTSRSQQ